MEIMNRQVFDTFILLQFDPNLLVSLDDTVVRDRTAPSPSVLGSECSRRRRRSSSSSVCVVTCASRGKRKRDPRLR
jgi:hypothetical protein